MKVRVLAAILGCKLEGDGEVDVLGVAPLQDATPTDISFVESAKMLSVAKESRAAAFLVGSDVEFWGKPILKASGNPRVFLAELLRFFAPGGCLPDVGVHPSAVVSDTARLGKGVRIGAHVYVGEDVRIADGVVVFPNCYIGDRVVIGEGSLMYPNVVVREDVWIGKGVRIHSGVVIGADGFGYTVNECGDIVKIPQIGGVVVEDGVEIGANSTIDRSTMGFTVIGRNTKIDNLVHVAHNVTIGENCFIAGQVGIAGSSRIGNNVVLAGQSGVKDHVSVGDRVKVAARSGVTRNIPAGAFVSGFPARDHGKDLRIQGLIWKLPDLLERLLRLENEVKEMKRRAS